MAKGKSSASSNTRKKHAAKKSGNPEGTDAASQPVKGQQQPKQRGQKESKLSKAQRKALPKVKQYIPPPKAPAPPIPDPLDSQGLGRTLPPELVVVLRRLGKKDEVTRRKGVEELKEGWVEPVLRAQKQASADEAESLELELKEEALVGALPVWLHHLSTLLHSAAHKSPSLALFTSLLSIPSCLASITNTLALGLLPGTQNRDIIGSWLVTSLEEGRRPGPGAAGLRKWSEVVYFSPLPKTATSELGDLATAEVQENRLDLTPNLALLVEYLSSSILSPAELHSDVHPQPVSSTANTPSTNSPAPSARVLAKALKQQSRPSAVTVPTLSSQTVEDDDADGSNDEERWGRYRLTGLLGLTWLLQNLPAGELPEALVNLLKTPALWTCLSPLRTSTLLEDAEDGDAPISIGYEQPGVRRAGYALLAVLVESYSAIVSETDLLELLSRAVLGSCWAEKEGQVWETAGQSIVVFLAKHRECWSVEAASDTISKVELTGDDDEGVSDDEEDEEDEDDPSSNEIESAPTSGAVPSSSGYNSFLSFLANTCPAHPHYTYPLLLVIVSTIPATILPLDSATAVSNLFSHFWSPADAHILSTHSLPGHNNFSAYQVFLQSALDCAAYLTGKAWRSEDAASKEVAASIVKEEVVDRAWTQGVLQKGGRGGQRRLGKGRAGKDEVEANMIGKILARAGAVDASLVDRVLPSIRQRTLDAAFPDGSSAAKSLLPRVLAIVDGLAVSAASLPTVSQMTESLVSDILRLAVGSAQQLSGQETPLAGEDKLRLGELWQVLGDLVVKHPANVDDEQYQVLVSELANKSTFLLNNLSGEQAAEIFSVFTTLPEEREERKAVAQALAAALSPASSLDKALRLQMTQAVLAQGSGMMAEEGWLDDTALEITEGALKGDKESLAAMQSVIGAFTGTVSDDASGGILAMVTTAVHTLTEDLLCPTDKSAEASVSARLEAALQVLHAYAKHNSAVLLSALHVQSLVAVHHLAKLLDTPASAVAEQVWLLAQGRLQNSVTNLRDMVLASLAGLLNNIACVIEPTELIRAAYQLDLGTGSLSAADVAAAVLPSGGKVSEELDEFASRPAQITMPVLDNIVSYSNGITSASATSYDNLGRSAFARHVEGLITLFYMDRTLAVTSPGLLATAMSFACFAADELAVASSSRGVFGPNVSIDHLERVVQDVGQVFSYVLTSAGDLPVGWHQKTIQSLKAKQPGHADVLQGLLSASHGGANASGREIHARVFRSVLNGALRSGGATATDAELWLAYGMSLGEKNTELAIAVITAVKELLLDGKAFDQAQNRLASTLTGVPLKKANTQGVTYLRLLAASAPPPGAASTFIPQQRAMFVMRHVAGWLTDESDEADDLAEEVEARVAEVYTALAPIVQDVPGAHWDSIFDLIESSLEAASLADETTYGLLYQNLVLLTEVKDLCLTNKALRATWTSRSAHLNLVLKLFLESQPTTSRSIPLEMIQEQLVDLLRGASADVVETADYGQLSSLLRTSPLPIQRTAYGLLHDLTVRKTGQLVLDVEASVADAEDGHEGKKTIELAPEVVEVIKQGKGVVWSDVAAHDGAHLVILGQLLAWMTVFDHFEDASNTLRGAYLDQIRNESLIEQGLLPLLFEMLGVSEVGAWNFPASSFAVDEFYIDLLEIHELADLTPLASHVYYRSLTSTPSIVRSFFEACKDRQLSLSLLNFTSRHFSPVIIYHEFAALKVPAAIAQLADEGLNVKVVTGGGASGVGSAEAVASYEIDEQPMEIGIRLPSDFPLKGVEVRDLRRVGVPENKWRGWLMGVQQLITSRNGLMLEALTVFKKNVALHFDGVVECAICYSIISLTDRTLPTKPCRTCKNRFHSSCLFKWFNSSHSSSCPMCRSLF